MAWFDLNRRENNVNVATNNAQNESTEAGEIDSDDDLDFMMQNAAAENRKTPSSKGRRLNAFHNNTTTITTTALIMILTKTTFLSWSR